MVTVETANNFISRIKRESVFFIFIFLMFCCLNGRVQHQACSCDVSSAYAWRGYVCLVCGHLCVPSLPGTLGRYLDFPHIPHRTSVGTHYVLTLNKSSTYGAMSSTALCKFLPKT